MGFFNTLHNAFIMTVMLFTLQNVLPVLKWVRGEPLSQDHWLELFRILHMPKGTTLENLNFGHILAASDHIIENADALKVSNDLLSSPVYHPK